MLMLMLMLINANANANADANANTNNINYCSSNCLPKLMLCTVLYAAIRFKPKVRGGALGDGLKTVAV